VVKTLTMSLPVCGPGALGVPEGVAASGHAMWARRASYMTRRLWACRRAGMLVGRTGRDGRRVHSGRTGVLGCSMGVPIRPVRPLSACRVRGTLR
jgi:hypothetical protein